MPLPLIADQGPPAAVSGPRVVLELDRARAVVRLAVEQTSVSDVLDALARRTGISIHHGELSREKRSVRCEESALQTALECLLGSGVNLVVRHAAGVKPVLDQSFPEEIWILRTGGVNSGDSIGSGSSQPAKAAVSEERGRDVERLVGLATSDDPVQRTQGLQQLAHRTGLVDAGVRGVMEKALGDAEPNVRAQAVFALARSGGSDAVPVLQQAMRDVDPTVRLMAVRTAGQDMEGMTLLREGVGDRDEAVREFAAMRLQLFAKAGGGAFDP